ncbi:MAG: threonine ammonia-lyase [Bacteroidales bacterium]
MSYFPSPDDVSKAKHNINHVVKETPLEESRALRKRYGASIFFKREDLQQVRSYKIRGAYNKISSLSEDEKEKGVVCASAGNHAQGVAFSCSKLKIRGFIYMPATTPRQKVNQVRLFGGKYVEIVLKGDTFDDTSVIAEAFAKETDRQVIHPFDDEKIIEGQGTVGLEIYQQSKAKIDYVFIPVGGGGLIAGAGSYLKTLSPDTKIIGVEPEGAASMKAALDAGVPVKLEQIDKFVDGASVKQCGKLNVEICKSLVDQIICIPEGKVCTTILELYNDKGIIVEPAGALSIAALDYMKDEIKGKNVVCVISGGNNDITRTEEIRERSMIYEGIKHYFIVNIPQRAGALKDFLENVLAPTDDITHFEYAKKTHRERGPIVIGIEVVKAGEIKHLMANMRKMNIEFEYLNDKPSFLEIFI